MLRRCFLRSMASAGLSLPLAIAQQRSGGMAPAEPFKPSDEPNHPIGEAKGLHPGRVVWVRDAKATTWDGTTGHWWDDASTDQKVVHSMTSRVLEDLTGRKDDKQAWDALFRSFNEVHQFGRAGYRPGERIAIKINCNQDRSKEWGVASAPSGPPPGRAGAPPTGARGGGMPPRGPLNGLPSPQAVVALVAQLIERAGVRGEDIMIYDATGMRNVGQPIFARVRANSGVAYQKVLFLVGTDYETGGRLAPEPDTANPVHFAGNSLPPASLPKQVTEAKYMINMALLRPHGMAGVTLTAKNHFGSVHFPEGGGWSPRTLHNSVMRTQAMGSYNALVDLVGHPHLGGKTMLFLLDGLYTAEHNEGNVYKWASFDDHWAASLLASQDPIAIDSVALDILRSEPRAVEVRGNPDNYLHEAALARKPPSGTVYKPNGTVALASLGAHEHWNNPAERRYSRNLGAKEGIELIARV